MRSLLSERTIRLKFNNHTSNPLCSEVGTPRESLRFGKTLANLFNVTLVRLTCLFNAETRLLMR